MTLAEVHVHRLLKVSRRNPNLSFDYLFFNQKIDPK